MALGAYNIGEEEIPPVREHRKKLCCVWSRIKSTTFGAHDAASGSWNEAVVHSGDLMIPEPIRHLNWMSRLATSTKLSIEISEEWVSPIPLFLMNRRKGQA